MLAALGISRQAYHQQRQRQQRRAAREALALEIVRQIRQHHPRMGTRKLHHLLKERHCAIGRDRLFRLLSEHELLIQPKRSYRRTTYAGLYRWPNLLPALRLERVGQLWVADITLPRHRRRLRLLGAGDRRLFALHRGLRSVCESGPGRRPARPRRWRLTTRSIRGKA
ncbi:MAG: IS3 family transposase [Ardenticatenales bacterium]|nr:IS3 family transposase [Ardenticatenales bacterium]